MGSYNYYIPSLWNNIVVKDREEVISVINCFILDTTGGIFPWIKGIFCFSLVFVPLIKSSRSIFSIRL